MIARKASTNKDVLLAPDGNNYWSDNTVSTNIIGSNGRRGGQRLARATAGQAGS